MTKKILILGGYGNTGLPIAKGLLAETDVSLVLAGSWNGVSKRSAGHPIARSCSSKPAVCSRASRRLCGLGYRMLTVTC